MTRIFLVLILVSWMLSSCATTTSTPDPLPVIVVDQQHMNTAGLEYQIPAGSGFVLDASTYDFGSSTPMAVQVVTGNLFYQTAWAGAATQQTVLVSDLKPLFNANPLTEFSSGQQLIVSIGSLSMQGRFKPIWVGVVNVK